MTDGQPLPSQQQPDPVPQLPPLPSAPPSIAQYSTPGTPLAPQPQFQPQQPPQFQVQQPEPQPQQQIASFPAQPQQAPQPQEPQPSALREMLSSRGVPVEQYQSDDELLNALGQFSADRQRLEYLARIGEQAISRQQQPTQQQPAQQQQQPAQSNQLPEWRPEWGALLTRDPESGLFVPKPGNELVAGQIAQIANQREAQRREYAERLMDDPIEFLKERGLGNLFEQERQRIIQEIRQQEQDRQVMTQVEQWNREVDPLLFQRDQAGNTVLNPLTGQPVLTELGQQVSQQRQRFSSWFQGVYGFEPDDALVMQNVAPIIEAHKSRQQAQPQPQSQAQPPVQAYDPAKNQDALQRMTVAAAAQQAMYTPNQNGTIAAASMNATLPQNSQATFTQSLREEAIRQGIISPDAW